MCAVRCHQTLQVPANCARHGFAATGPEVQPALTRHKLLVKRGFDDGIGECGAKHALGPRQDAVGILHQRLDLAAAEDKQGAQQVQAGLGLQCRKAADPHLSFKAAAAGQACTAKLRCVCGESKAGTSYCLKRPWLPCWPVPVWEGSFQPTNWLAVSRSAPTLKAA